MVSVNLVPPAIVQRNVHRVEQTWKVQVAWAVLLREYVLVKVRIVSLNFLSDLCEILLTFDTACLWLVCALGLPSIIELHLIIGTVNYQWQAAFVDSALFIINLLIVYNIIIACLLLTIKPSVRAKLTASIVRCSPLFIFGLALLAILSRFENLCFWIQGVETENPTGVFIEINNGPDRGLLNAVLFGNVFDLHIMQVSIV